MLDRGLDAFQSSEDLLNLAGSPDRVMDQSLILGGDAVFLKERMAIASTHMPRVQSDESTMTMSFATAMVEAQVAKGSGSKRHRLGQRPESPWRPLPCDLGPATAC